MTRTHFLATCMAAAVALLAVAQPVRADDSKALLADAKRFPSLRSFRMKVDSVDPASGLTSQTLTYVAPDSLRVDVPAKHFTAVIIGSYLWLRNRAGHWKRARMTAETNTLAAVRETSAIAERVSGKTVRFDGTETLGGKRMHVYDIEDPDGGGASERIWIGTRDGYPHRIEQRDGAFASTATYSSFNQLFSVSQ